MPVDEDQVRAPDDPGLAMVGSVAVAVARTPRGYHTGIIVREMTGGPSFQILHLAFHYQLVRELLPPKYHWVEPEIPVERALHVAALCDEIASRYSDGRLAYAFRYRGGGFDIVSGELMSTVGRGLSCATFVLAVFASVGIDILDLSSWPSRAEDAAWQSQIVELGRRLLPDGEAHWSYLEASELGCLRYRPQEVAVGATSDTLPAQFGEVEEPASRLAARLPIVEL